MLGIEEGKSEVRIPNCEVRPNPVRNELIVSYQLAQPGRVTCQVYDAAGNRVASLDQGVRSLGMHRLHWNASRLAPGIYFCELVTPGWSRTFRVTRVN